MINVNAEKHVIYAMMNGMIDEVTDQVKPELFQSPLSQKVSLKIWSVSSRGAVTMNVLLKEFKFDDQAQNYIQSCAVTRVEEGELSHHIISLKVAYAKKIANEYISKINKMVVDSNCSLRDITKLINDGANLHIDTEEAKKLVLDPEEYAAEHYLKLTERANSPDVEQGIRIKNLGQLDSTFFGLKGGDLIMGCAQSGHGKTALALNIAENVAVTQKKIVYYANAEMNEEELTSRIVSNKSLIPAKDIMTGSFDGTNKDIALKRLYEVYKQLKESGLYLSKIPHMSVSTIRRGFKKMENGGKRPEMIIIDYIGRMEPTFDTRSMQEWQILYRLAEDCKTLAVELDVPILVLAQLNDEGKLEGAKKMRNACDGLLYFELVTESDEEIMTDFQKKTANYKIVKSKVRRNDNSKPIFINFDKKYQRISEV